MIRVVQASCPGCRRVLRIPAEWVAQPMRCKHCGLILQAQARASVPTLGATASVAVAPTAAVAVAAPATFTTPGSPFPAVAAGAHPQDSTFVFGSASSTSIPIRARRSSTGAAWKKAGVVLACVLSLVGTAGYFLWPAIQAQLNGEGQSGDAATAQESGEKPGTGSVATRPSEEGPKAGKPANTIPLAATFPRRALLIGINNYVYANPVSYFVGKGGGEHHPLERICSLLRISFDQLVEVSDAAKAGRAVPPLKPVIEQTVKEFLEGSRAQDRLLVAFTGHAVEIDDEPYLVPIEGELTVKETLLPLRWLLDQVGQCKARQKVLILDVCRFDLGRGLERPGSGPLGEKFEAAVKEPPPGVQIWLACAAGQQSQEGESGSVFFQAVERMLPPLVGKRLQKPDEPLPVEALATAVKDEVELTAKQSPRLYGKEPESGAAFNPEEKPPAKLVARSPAAEGDRAVRAEVQRILDELDLPPIRPPRAQTPLLKLETLVPFSAQVLEAYKADYTDLKEVKDQREKHPLRIAVLDTADALRKHAGTSLIDFIPAASGASDAAKKTILNQQREPALIFLDLRTKLERLRELAEQREEETKRWQAHYDFVLSQCLARMAYIHEYNLMQGKIRKDDLPALENFHAGHRLASRERLQSDKDIRDLAAESKKLLQQVIKKYPGTPWEILAKRERFTALGLEWQPARQ